MAAHACSRVCMLQTERADQRAVQLHEGAQAMEGGAQEARACGMLRVALHA